MGACTQTGPGQIDVAAAPPKAGLLETAANANSAELLKATEYWRKEFGKTPRDAKAALNYARNLKALGEKRQALAVLQQASVFHSGNRDINSEYGRLALEFDQVSVAQRLLEQADDPAHPDWRVLSARGTVLAKQGSYRDAIPFYERALVLAPDQPSILNNLALAHAMGGHPDQAEPLLERAAAAGAQEPRVSQNLALILGLQGKYDEARLVAARHMPADSAAANVDYVRRIVMLDPQPMSPAQAPPTNVGVIPAKAPGLQGTVVRDAATGWAPKVAVAPSAQ